MALEFTRVGFAPDFVPYEAALEQQLVLHEAVLAGRAPSTVLLLEHEPVYTAGRRTENHERPLDGTPVVPVDRGGKLTWHGPGQLVGYPILSLPEPTRVAKYVDVLEQVIINVLTDYGLAGTRMEGRSGVWLDADAQRPARKIAAIGIRIKRRVTMHGFAINCSNDLRPFQQIVPCGISDAGVSSISAESVKNVTPLHIVSRVEEELRKNEALLVLDAAADARPTGTAEPTGDHRPEGVLL